MVARNELMAFGMQAYPADLVGMDINPSLAAAGTTQATATSLKGCGFAIVTTVGANSGVILDATSGDQLIVNGGLNTLTIYPPVGSQINVLSTNTGIQLAVGKAALFMGQGKRYAALLSS